MTTRALYGGTRDGTTAVGALIDCPACGLRAEIVDRFELDSTAGPVEHVKTRCVHRRWSLMPTDLLRAQAQVP